MKQVIQFAKRIGEMYTQVQKDYQKAMVRIVTDPEYKKAVEDIIIGAKKTKQEEIKEKDSPTQSDKDRAGVMTIGPDGFVYSGRITTQDFDERYFRR